MTVEAVVISEATVVSQIARARRKYKLGLISNFAYPLGLMRTLERFDLVKFFDAIMISGDIGWRKPSARIFQKALESLRVGASETVFVGDSPLHDIEGAHQLNIKAILFDLHGTLAYVKNPVTHQEASDYLVSHGYEVYPQTFMAAWQFVAFIDYPKHGYKDYPSFLKRLLWRIKTKVDKGTLDGLAKLYEQSQFELYPETPEAVKKTKEDGFKTAIVTTIARFKFQKALQPILPYLDTVVTGYEARCEKSNPKMFKRTLEILNVRPSEAVMIGDDVSIDILIPKKIGMYTILLDRKHKIGGSGFSDATVGNLTEALKIIEAWIRR